MPWISKRNEYIVFTFQWRYNYKTVNTSIQKLSYTFPWLYEEKIILIRQQYTNINLYNLGYNYKRKHLLTIQFRLQYNPDLPDPDLPDPDLPCPPIYRVPQFTVSPNLPCSPIYRVPQFTVFPNLPCSPIYRVPQFTWPYSFPGRAQ